MRHSPPTNIHHPLQSSALKEKFTNRPSIQNVPAVQNTMHQGSRGQSKQWLMIFETVKPKDIVPKKYQTKEPLTVSSAHMCTSQPSWMKNFDLRNLDCPHSSLKEQARIASGWRSREVGRGAGPKFGEITPLAPHLAIPHHPPGLTLFQTQVHESFAPHSQ